MTRKTKKKRKKLTRGVELALDADGIGYGWHWTRMVLDADGIGCGWWLDADGGGMRMVTGSMQMVVGG